MGCRACLADAGGDSPAPFAALVFLSALVALRFKPAHSEVWPTDGRCIACRYDLSGLGDSGLCPECGGAFPRPRLIRRSTHVVLSKARLPVVLLAWLLAIIAANLPFFAASNGAPLALADAAWGWGEWWRGADGEVLDRMLRNRARARARDPSARATLVWIIAPSVLWSLVPGRWRAIALVLAHIALGVGLTLGLAAARYG